MRSFEKKIYLGLGLLVLASVPILASGFLSWRRIVTEQKELITDDAQGLLDVENLRLAAQIPAQLGPLYVISRDDHILAELDKANKAFEEKISLLKNDDLDPQERFLLSKIESAYKAQSAVSARGYAMSKSGATALQVHRYFENNSPKNTADRDYIRELAAHRESKFSRAKAELTATTDRIIIVLAVAAALSLGFSALIIGLLIKIVNEKKQLDSQREQILLKEKKISAIRKETLETVSHDLKTPLTSLKLRLQMLKRSGGANAEHALRSVESMEKMIRDFLDQSSLDAGHLNLQLEKCDLTPYLRDLASQLEPLATHKSIRFDFFAGNLPRLECDPARVQQVVMNLLSNAIKFTPEGGRISFGAKEENGEIMISVADSGPGIPAEKIPRLFERYWQDSGTAAKGHGLGLSIANGLASAHGGKITVKSEPGKGTEFCLHLPVRGGSAFAGNAARDLMGAELAAGP
jgi:signal transduction histidine kinase